MNKIFTFLGLLVFTGCNHTMRSLPNPPSSGRKSTLPRPAPSVPDRGGIDPLQTDQIINQSHVYPFLFISALVAIICFGPLLYIYTKPQALKARDWVKKKLDKRAV